MATPSSSWAPTPTRAPDTRTVARLSAPEQLVAKPLGGFKPGTGVRIEVTGARTVAAVVIPPDFKTMAAEAIEASFRDSAARQRANLAGQMCGATGRELFAAALDFVVSEGAPKENKNPTTMTAEGERIMEESELVGAQLLTNEERSMGGKWVTVEASAATYEPGSIVYLVSTSEPKVFGTATVDKEGNAKIVAAMPLEALGAGAHRFRVVGTRDLGGVTVGADGEVQLSDATVAEIKRFDTGTTGTARIYGQAAIGGEQDLVRYIPLREPTPWYWLLVPLFTLLLFAYLRRTRRLFGRRFTAALVIGALSGIPPMWIGWIGMFFDLGFIGLLSIPAVPLLLTFVRVRPKDGEPDEPTGLDRLRAWRDSRKGRLSPVEVNAFVATDVESDRTA